MIGDKDTSLAATTEQFQQQAVAAVDLDPVAGTVVEDAPQDPSIDEAIKRDEKVAEAAGKAAASVVEKLHQD